MLRFSFFPLSRVPDLDGSSSQETDMRKVNTEPRRRRSLSDPLAVALLPPPDETPFEMEQRLLAEHQAKKISDGIDEMLRQESHKKKKANASEVKVLLLGQSESGKSTTLKRECMISFFHFINTGDLWVQLQRMRAHYGLSWLSHCTSCPCIARTHVRHFLAHFPQMHDTRNCGLSWVAVLEEN